MSIWPTLVKVNQAIFVFRQHSAFTKVSFLLINGKNGFVDLLIDIFWSFQATK